MNNDILNNNHSIEKEKMLLKMRKEITKLENEIKLSNITNSRIYMLRGLKILLRTCQLIAPYLVTFGITFNIFSFVGATPFIRDKSKQGLEIMKEYGSDGNIIRYEQQYEEFSNSSDVIMYYGKWNYDYDNFYYRFVETYKLKDFTEEEIINLLNDDIKTLQDVLGEPISKMNEGRNDLSKEELERNPYLQAKVYSTDESNFIIKKETLCENVIFTLIWMLLFLGFSSVIYFFRYRWTRFDYVKCIKEIITKNPTINKNELKKKLELRIDNYNRLEDNYVNK